MSIPLLRRLFWRTTRRLFAVLSTIAVCWTVYLYYFGHPVYVTVRPRESVLISAGVCFRMGSALSLCYTLDTYPTVTCRGGPKVMQERLIWAGRGETYIDFD